MTGSRDGIVRSTNAGWSSRSAELGFHIVRLDTNRALPEAKAMYLKHGYREVEPFSHHPYSHFWFEKGLG